MTNYIEDMMKTAGVEPTYKEPICCQDRRQVYGLNCLGCMKYDEDNGRCLANLIYPDFTAEKQLEVIKLISEESILVIDKLPVSKVWALKTYSQHSGRDDDFTQALAQLTTELMNAGELDKEIVKGILENAR